MPQRLSKRAINSAQDKPSSYFPEQLYKRYLFSSDVRGEIADEL